MTGDGGGGISRAQVALLAVAAGASVGNLYYAQPLLPEMARAFGVAAREAGLVPMLTQLGYAAGMLLFVPLGDVVERRGLMLALLGAVTASLVATALAGSFALVAAASFAVGLTNVVPQLAVPLAAHLAAPPQRGRVVGTVMSGLLVGILAARTAAGFVGERLGWRAVYVLAAALMIALAAALRALFPPSRPEKGMPYPRLLASMASLVRREGVLREAALLGAGGMGAFSAFWATLAFRLEAAPFHLGPRAAGLFGLVGIAGALAATAAGRLVDRLPARDVTAAGLAVALAGYGALLAGGDRLAGIAAGVVLLDLGVQGAHVANLARIHALPPAERSRRNTVYMVSYFAGGALGTAAATWAWSAWGWPGVCAVGAALLALPLLVWWAGRPRNRRAVPS
ncbi:MAG TPA: MFS transporter [Anaeromyxobacteraceae bacterium]|nr:MFS transporter [Anaeromyxobacteraceae bacterium]